MASNYMAICTENRESYGTKGAQKSGKLAADLYDDRTHFIYELLQNAEDALARRGSWQGERKVEFSLKQTQLIFSHFGKPFDEADVRSVCEIAESTKDESSIGRFGLGFKSVYTVTDMPEIHSGDEDFSIEHYIFPKRLERSVREVDETQIILPLKPEDPNIAQDITRGFRQLGPTALLFLRHIDEINWSVEGSVSGFYIRTPPETLGPNVQRITVIGNECESPDIEQSWLIFHRDVFSTEKKRVGQVEIAFSLVEGKDDTGHLVVQPLVESPLVVFFPTVVESHLGFLVQGPFRTTPSRDNIPLCDPWNQHLVKETSHLLVDALHWMRDNSILGVSALRCLPLERRKFPENSRFAPMFNIVLEAFREQALLPTLDGKHVPAHQAMLARTQELREVFSSHQLAMLFDVRGVAWLSGDITQDKTPELRHYLMRELDIDEITPAKLVPSLSWSFLEAQSDNWILLLYEFLSGQENALRRNLDTVPLIRLEDGTHVVAHENGKAKAFLPSAITTSFPTMRGAVCLTPEVRLFLNSLGIEEPDPVDDVIWNILPKYQQQNIDMCDDVYKADIERICAAFSTDSTSQKEKLRSTLRDIEFVMAIDTGDGRATLAKPRKVYIATDRLQQLFDGVPDILIVNDGYSCLQGENIRDLLVSSGASRYLMPEATPSKLGDSEKAKIRQEAGLERASWEQQPEDFTLRGLTKLLEYLPALKPEIAVARVKLLWEALVDLEARGTNAFYGSYRWGYFHETKTARFDADFIRTLNQVAWVPNIDGKLVLPRFVVFDTLGWKPNQFLQTKIDFKPPIIDQLAKEVGIDPAILDLLRRDPSVVAELTSRLSANSTQEYESTIGGEQAIEETILGDVYDEVMDLYGEGMPDIPLGSLDPGKGDVVGIGRRSQGSFDQKGSEKYKGNGKRTPAHAGGRPFISYVGTHPNDENLASDGIDQAKRMQIEAAAIDFIIDLEPALCRTPEGNPGFDLYEVDCCDNPTRWVEVKSMTGCLEDRPVGLSHTQFDYAREKGDSYWLYIVEFATDPTKTRLLKIHNPVSQARTFTFDHGWREVAISE